MIGIYEIVNIIDNKRYIGSSICIKNRKYNHFAQLRKNIHYNEYLQRAFNKYKEINFSFNIIEELEDLETELSLRLKEQAYIDSYKWENLYNVQKIVLDTHLRQQKSCRINKWLSYQKESTFFIVRTKKANRTFTFPTLEQAVKFRAENWEKLEGIKPFEEYSKEKHFEKISERTRKSGGNVYFNKSNSKWIAMIIINRKDCYLGCYDTKEKAIKIKLEAEEKYYNQKLPWNKEEAEKYKVGRLTFKTGAKGVDFSKKANKWRARGGTTYIGLFNTEAEALQARQAWVVVQSGGSGL